MENMDKEFTVQKWVLIVWPKKMPQKEFSPKCVPKPKSSRFLKKALSHGVRNPW